MAGKHFGDKVKVSVRKEWEKPKLTILQRTRPENQTLQVCKVSGEPGPSVGHCSFIPIFCMNGGS